MIPLKSYEEALLNLPVEIKEAEINAEEHEQVAYKSKWGSITSTNSSELTALYVRATGEKTGYAYTENLNESGETVIERAYKNGIYIETPSVDLLNDQTTAYFKSDVATKGKTGLNIGELPKMDLEIIKAQVLRFDRCAHKLPNLVDYSVTLCVDQFKSRVINSKGVDISSAYQVWHYEVEVTCEYEDKRYDGSYSGNVSSFELMDFNEAVMKAHEMILNQYAEGQMVSGTYPVLLDSRVVINILTTAWQLFSGPKYFEGSSALSDKLGQHIGASVLSIEDANRHPLTGYKYAFDSEGTPCQVHRIVEQGKFIGLLHNLRSAASMGTQSTGNAGRVALLTGSIPTDIIVTPRIIYVVPSQKSKETLLEEMISGVYITDSSDIFHSINIGSGDFSIPCSGMVVKGGLAAQSVRSLTLNGNLLDLFRHIKSVGNDLKIEPFLLKSYCIGAPSVLVDRLNISCK
ncbi:TldD/PmbA family protein [Fusibacter ferrireducens]|uniref:TldD/PmbA family protein n=1 Tax=Fusibacter ferrireducens TaxID=2785058 RepID=A0ABR9ZV28_9FIRM|nr:metallopeptidase TldD-related protein [Fusibacter ferrireducens]MBF4693439.1 TldD/PmbA family protein [Fusibacter ferrireducens]